MRTGLVSFSAGGPVLLLNILWTINRKRNTLGIYSEGTATSASVHSGVLL